MLLVVAIVLLLVVPGATSAAGIAAVTTGRVERNDMLMNIDNGSNKFFNVEATRPFVFVAPAVVEVLLLLGGHHDVFFLIGCVDPTASSGA
jgi:hypothetical protein